MSQLVKSPLTQEETTAWLRGLLALAWADGSFDESEKELIDALSHEELETDTDINKLEPITPKELAIALGDDTMAENFLRTAVMVALADGVYSEPEDELLHDFCNAFGLKVEALDALRANLQQAKLEAEKGNMEGAIASAAGADISDLHPDHPDHPDHHGEILGPVKDWLDGWDIHDPKVAHMVCKLVPPQCPFERDIVIFGRKVAHIPAMCKLNPLYEQLVGLRFRALSYLADDCKEDISKYY
ncbi:MAG: Mo-dependent nitrogenase C-terminal domain-containing protein [Cyanobacteriota bacterium]|nr:Mo-dependent nitrogenase C-terminal domain-containing protein [Cyanobacteriota bacterium]